PGSAATPSVLLDEIPDPDLPQPKRPGVLLTRSLGVLDTDDAGAWDSLQIVVAGITELQTWSGLIRSVVKVQVMAYHAPRDGAAATVAPLPDGRLDGVVPGPEYAQAMSQSGVAGSYLMQVGEDADGASFFTYAEFSTGPVLGSGQTYLGRENLPTAVAQVALPDQSQPVAAWGSFPGWEWEGGIGLYTDGSITSITRRAKEVWEQDVDTGETRLVDQYWTLHVGGDSVPAVGYAIDYTKDIPYVTISCDNYTNTRWLSYEGGLWRPNAKPRSSSEFPIATRCIYDDAMGRNSAANKDLYTRYQDDLTSTIRAKVSRSVFTAGYGANGAQNRSYFIHGLQSGAIEGNDRSLRDYWLSAALDYAGTAASKAAMGYISLCDNFRSLSPSGMIAVNFSSLQRGGCFQTELANVPEEVQYFRTAAEASVQALLPELYSADLRVVDGVADFGSGFSNTTTQDAWLVLWKSYYGNSPNYCMQYSQCMPAYVTGASATYIGHGHGRDLMSVLFPADIDAVTYYLRNYQVEYSQPTVIALLAAPPRFKDLAALDGGDAYGNSSTSFGLTTGKSEETVQTGSVTAGVFAEFEQEFSIFGLKIFTAKASFEATFTDEWEKSHTTSRSKTTTFSTVGGEDTVALTVIPMDAYYFDVGQPNADGGVTVQENAFAIKAPYEPITTAWEVGYYNEIAERFNLPLIGSDVIQHTVGRPETYVGYTNDPAFTAKADKFITAGYGANLIGQELVIGQENTSGQSSGWDIEASACAGAGGLCVGGIYGQGRSKGKFYTDFSETSFSAEQQGMARDPSWTNPEPYQMAWRLQARYVPSTNRSSRDCNPGEEDSNGCWYFPTYPYVTYGVRAVRSGPALPDDLRVDAVTSSSVTLTWDNAVDPLNQATHYQVMVDAGYGFETRDAWRVPATETGFVVNGLSPETTHSFALIAENDHAFKPYDISAHSEAVSARTRPSGIATPDVFVDESPIVVPMGGDARLGVTVVPVGPDLSKVSYQWERYTKTGWVTVTGATRAARVINPVGVSDFGIYRCVVTETVDGKKSIVNSLAIEVKQGKRAMALTLGAAMPDGSHRMNLGELITLRADMSGTMSALRPSGAVTFQITGPSGTE
ncbi:MAG: fibronectin type III domain-containing protein, partial [Bifidobacteriaceae bacterium]|nr:fibronectin type III domain-containing protein [Bifidobacteriaceae bacterium]